MKIYTVTKTSYDSDFSYIDKVFTTAERARQYCEDERAAIQTAWDADEQKRQSEYYEKMLAWHKAAIDRNPMTPQPWSRWNNVDRYTFEYDEYELES